MRQMWSRVVCEWRQLGRTTPSPSRFEASRVRPRTRLDARDPECGSTSLDKLFRRSVPILSNFKMFRSCRDAILRRKFMGKNEGVRRMV